MGTTRPKLILGEHQSPGDIIAFTGLLRDIHKTFPGRYLTDVDCPFREAFNGNPYLTPLGDDKEAWRIHLDMDGLGRSCQEPVSMLGAWHRHLGKLLNVTLAPTGYGGDLYLTPEEMQRSPLAPDGPYWIVNAGGKRDCEVKWTPTAVMQDTVNHFAGSLSFVQMGTDGGNHYHPRLDNAIDAIGKTDSLRELIRLFVHADGFIGPVTLGMHLAAAVPRPAGVRGKRPAVILAGGRESRNWYQYSWHHIFDAVGKLPCCDNGGCWKSQLSMNSPHARADTICVDVMPQGDGLPLMPRCHSMVTADMVIRAIEDYRQ